MAEHTSKKVDEGGEYIDQQFELIDKAITAMLGETNLPALLFINTDNTVTRVDVDQITDHRTLEMLRAVMNLTAQTQFKRQRWQDMPRT